MLVWRRRCRARREQSRANSMQVIRANWAGSEAMRFVTARERSRTLHIEITPMIDVVFLLIIFFMTTAQFARMTRAELALPIEPGEQERAPEEAGLVINLTQAGEIIVSDQTLDLAQLEQPIWGHEQARNRLHRRREDNRRRLLVAPYRLLLRRDLGRE